MDLKQIILDFPNQFRVGIESAKNVKFEGTFKNVLLCGMGGSIIPAEILKLITYNLKLKTNFYIHRDYDLPEWASKESLIICTSWSGNTEETITSYESGHKKDIPLITISKGGKLKELSQKNGVPLILLPDEPIPPRLGVGYMFSALFTVLASNGLIENQLSDLEKLEKTLNPEKFDDKAQELAQKITNKIPLNYASYKWRNLAAFWKIFFNESAKTHSFWNAFPGMTHQEIAGFNKKDGDKFFALLLKDKDDDPRQNKSLEKLSKILDDSGYGYEIINIEGGNVLEKIFNNYLFAALTSMYSAQFRRVDPGEDELIEKFKEMEK